jgi:hypothetical protein
MPNDPDIIEVPFLWIPDGTPEPAGWRTRFSDPIELRARFEWGPGGSRLFRLLDATEPASGPAPLTSASPTDDQIVPVPDQNSHGPYDEGPRGDGADWAIGPAPGPASRGDGSQRLWPTVSVAIHDYDAAVNDAFTLGDWQHIVEGLFGGTAPTPSGCPIDCRSTTQHAFQSPGNQLAQVWLPFLLDEPPAIIRPPLEDFPTDPTKPPAPGFEWRGRPDSTPGDPNGNWYNPGTGETLRPDLNHPEPLGPHYDYRAPNGKWYRWFPTDNMIRKA